MHAPGGVVSGSGTVHKVFGAFYRTWREQLSEIATNRSDKSNALALPQKLSKFISERLHDYAKTRDDLAKDDGTSGASVALSLGTISPRQLVAALPNSPAGETLLRQLCWRDWFAHLLVENPALMNAAMKPKYDNIRWLNDEDDIAAWKTGKTGYPVVDAAMRQLVTTGCMHNRARMIAASFLVKHLLVDWRVGEKFFREHLLDADISQNVGNWQWIAGTGPDAAPYFRIFNPSTQQKKFDPQFKYVQKYVPEFGTEAYAKPIVEHSFARERALSAYRNAI